MLSFSPQNLICRKPLLSFVLHGIQPFQKELDAFCGMVLLMPALLVFVQMALDDVLERARTDGRSLEVGRTGEEFFVDRYFLAVGIDTLPLMPSNLEESFAFGSPVPYTLNRWHI